MFIDRLIKEENIGRARQFQQAEAHLTRHR
jgi:hypothetical protein